MLLFTRMPLILHLDCIQLQCLWIGFYFDETEKEWAKDDDSKFVMVSVASATAAVTVQRHLCPSCVHVIPISHQHWLNLRSTLTSMCHFISRNSFLFFLIPCKMHFKCDMCSLFVQCLVLRHWFQNSRCTTEPFCIETKNVTFIRFQHLIFFLFLLLSPFLSDVLFLGLAVFPVCLFWLYFFFSSRVKRFTSIFRLNCSFAVAVATSGCRFAAHALHFMYSPVCICLCVKHCYQCCNASKYTI